MHVCGDVCTAKAITGLWVHWCTLAYFWSYTNKITLRPGNREVFLGSGLRSLQQKTFMSFPSCLQRLCAVALRVVGSVLGAGSAQRVPLSPGGPGATASPPLGTPHSLREAPQDIAHGHIQTPHLGRSPAPPPHLM